MQHQPKKDFSHRDDSVFNQQNGFYKEQGTMYPGTATGGYVEKEGGET